MTNEDGNEQGPEDATETELLLDLIQQHLAESSTYLKSIYASLSRPTLTFGDGLFFGFGFTIAAAVVAVPAAFLWLVAAAVLAGSR